MNRSVRWALGGAGVILVAGGTWLVLGRREGTSAADREAAIRDVLSEASETRIRAACTACHVFPEPDILPRSYWPTAIRGMYQIAERRGVEMPDSAIRPIAWYVLNAPETLPEAPGRTDAGPGTLTWEVEPWRPGDAPPPLTPAVTHLQAASLFGGRGLDLIASDVSTNRVYALRPYAPDRRAVELGEVPNPGRVAVTDLDRDGRQDVVVAALGQLFPTNDPVGSVVWLRSTGPEEFMPVVLADGLGRVADVQATDLNGDGRTDLLVAVFGWMEGGALLWLENTGEAPGGVPSFVRHDLDPRPGFTDARAADLDGDGRLDVVALIAQEFQQVMIYWAEEDGYRGEIVFQAPNPDWGFTGMEVVDFTGDGATDVIVVNGDNLDLTVAKPYHGVGMVENLGGRRFEYRHLTAMYGAHRAVPVDLDGGGRMGLLVSAYLPPTVEAPEPAEALVWLQRVGPSQLVRRVLKAEGVDHMTMAAGDVTGDGRPDVALGFMDLGVVDPRQAHPGPSPEGWVSLWRNLGARGRVPDTDGVAVIDWRAR